VKKNRSQEPGVRSQKFLFCILYFVFWILFFVSPVFAEQKSLTVAAASDMSFALKEIAKKFEKDTSIKVVLSFGSTGMLSQQIENGAPFDIFFAASEKYIDELGKKGFVASDTKQLYAQGRIVLAVHKNSHLTIKRLEYLLSPSIKKIAIANPNHAPYGIAAMEALKKLNLWDTLKSKLIYGENIRQTLQYVQTGDVSAGIIALSVANVPEITYTMIDDNLHNPINQIVAVVKTTKAEKEARLFIDYINSSAGRAVMRKYGFRLPGEF